MFTVNIIQYLAADFVSRRSPTSRIMSRHSKLCAQSLASVAALLLQATAGTLPVDNL